MSTRDIMQVLLIIKPSAFTSNSKSSLSMKWRIETTAILCILEIHSKIALYL